MGQKQFKRLSRPALARIFSFGELEGIVGGRAQIIDNLVGREEEVRRTSDLSNKPERAKLRLLATEG
jgi:hypothetical protein